MPCPRCGGWLYDHKDDLGLRCLMCGHPVEPPPTVAQLRAAGILYNEFHKEGEGHGRRGLEYISSKGPALGRLHEEE